MIMSNSYYKEALWLQNLRSNNFSDLVLVLITNKTHYTITMLCVKNSFVEVNNMWRCDPTLSLELHSAETSDGDRDTIQPITRRCTIKMILKLLF